MLLMLGTRFEGIESSSHSSSIRWRQSLVTPLVSRWKRIGVRASRAPDSRSPAAAVPLWHRLVRKQDRSLNRQGCSGASG